MRRATKIKDRERWNQVVKAAKYLNSIKGNGITAKFSSSMIIIRECIDSPLYVYGNTLWIYTYNYGK